MFASKPLDFVCYCGQHHMTVNCDVSFEPVGCNCDGPKGDVLTALYNYIDVIRLTESTRQLNAVNPDSFIITANSRLLFSMVNSKWGPNNQ